MRVVSVAAILLVAGVGLFAPPAFADEAADLAAIKAQLNTIQQDYGARIHALEIKLAKAEAEVKAAKTAASSAKATAATAQVAANTAQTTAVTAQTAAQSAADTAEEAAAPPPPKVASQNAFNPGIAAVLNGFYVASSRDTKSQRILGFANGDESGLPARGFSIGESEVSLAANIDPEFYGFLDFSFDAENQVGVEEGYIQTKDLPWGLTAKAGRFLSGIGYINERHAHDWSFSDAPLPYRAFLNDQYGDDGLQLRWLAPTDQFLEFGVEAFRGDSYPAAGAQHSGQGTVTAFVHTGNDINDASSWLAGLSYLHSRAKDRDTGGGHLFTGTDDLGIASLVYKWAPNGNPTVNNLALTGEFFYGQEDGTYDLLPFGQDRYGWYAQGIYQFMPQWSVGLRYAALHSGGVPVGLTGSELDDFGNSPNAATALLEYDTSEFGRLRLQYTHDESGLKPNDELVFQYTVIYGPHGAHRY